MTQIRSSANYKLVEEGFAYPLFYQGLEIPLRNAFTAAAIYAYNADLEMWPYGWSARFSAKQLSALQEYYCVFPKLFRRLLKYMKNSNRSTKGFVKALGNGSAGGNDSLAGC